MNMGFRIEISERTIIQNIFKQFLEEEKKNAGIIDSMIQFVKINKGSRDCKTRKKIPFQHFSCSDKEAISVLETWCNFMFKIF